jgi:NADH dehydrogenase FAD-containing subunit
MRKPKDKIKLDKKYVIVSQYGGEEDNIDYDYNNIIYKEWDKYAFSIGRLIIYFSELEESVNNDFATLINERAHDPGLRIVKYLEFREKVDILILEATSRLLGVLPEKVGIDVKQRLRELNVRVQVNSMVTEVESGFVKLKNGERLEHDLLIWATGVRAASVNFTHPIELDMKGRIPTNGLLQMQNHENIFIIGDECCIVDEDGISAPPTAQDAIHQAKFLTQVLPKLLQNQKPNYYTCMHHGFIIMLGGKWGVLTWGKWYFKGLVVYFLRQAADFNYFKSVLGIKKAIKYLWFGQRVFTRND